MMMRFEREGKRKDFPALLEEGSTNKGSELVKEYVKDSETPSPRPAAVGIGLREARNVFTVHYNAQLGIVKNHRL